MKSKTAWIDAGLFRHLLRRFWPLYLGYFVLLVLLLPASLPGTLDPSGPDAFNLGFVYAVLEKSSASVVLSFAAGFAFAGAMFHFLYQSRSCGMIHSLPLRRETIFTTSWLAGLLPMLLADLLVMLITWLVNLDGGVRVFESLVTWLWATVLANLFFYHFAVLCALLTGNLVILPLVYVVLNFTAIVVETCAAELMSDLLYGVVLSSGRLAWASPFVFMLLQLHASPVITNGAMSGYALEGLGALGVYALVSPLFLALALWLYRRRQLECASDVVAVPVLKPIFKYCMCFGTALVFATMMLNILELNGALYGWTGALILLLLLLAGAFLGYFAAEMLLRKSLRAFRGTWRGFLVSAVVLCLLLVVVKTDVFGVERRVPAPDEVRMVSLSPNSDFDDAKEIAAVTQFHRHLIAHGPANTGDASCDSCNGVCLNYTLSNGRSLQRWYDIYACDETLAEEYLALINLPGAILSRLTIEETETVWIDNYPQKQSMQISAGMVERVNEYDWSTLLELTASEARELYEQGVLPDARAGRIDLRRQIDDYFGSREDDVIIEITVSSAMNNEFEGYSHTLLIRICPESENTLRWLAAHGLELELKN